MSKLWAIIWTGSEDTVLYWVHTLQWSIKSLSILEFFIDVGEVRTGEKVAAAMC